MKNLVYLSTARGLLNDEVLLDILNAARKNNRAHYVTGVLLYCGGTFIQVLEGEEDAVEEIFGKISQDIRHKNIVMLMDEPIAARNFPDWTMGFTTVNPSISEDLISNFTSTDRILAHQSKATAVFMLKSFIESNHLVINH